MATLEPPLSDAKNNLVTQTICERANGLFLHARLVTDNLTEGLRDGTITEETALAQIGEVVEISLYTEEIYMMAKSRRILLKKTTNEDRHHCTASLSLGAGTSHLITVLKQCLNASGYSLRLAQTSMQLWMMRINMTTRI